MRLTESSATSGDLRTAVDEKGIISDNWRTTVDEHDAISGNLRTTIGGNSTLLRQCFPSMSVNFTLHAGRCLLDFSRSEQRAQFNLPPKQQGLEGQAGGESDQVTPAFDAMATQLYGNLGGLMSLYRANPPTVATFFDLETLRRPSKKPPAGETPKPATPG